MTFFHKPYFIGIYISSLNLSELNEQKERERERGERKTTCEINIHE